MRLFLDAKAWQLFLVLIGIAVVAQAITMSMVNPFPAILLSAVVSMALYFGWLLAIASEAGKRVNQSLQQSTSWMVIGLAYVVLYVCISMIFLFSSEDTGSHVPGWIFPMHLLAMLAIFYSMAFAAKCLVTLERQQRVTFFDYGGVFVLLWLFPIGVWIIQPRVNKLLGAG